MCIGENHGTVLEYVIKKRVDLLITSHVCGHIEEYGPLRTRQSES